MVREILGNTAVDWVLFSFIESLIFSGLYYYMGNLKKMKWHEIGIMGIMNALISQLFPAVVYQFIIVIWLVILLKNINKSEKLLRLIKIVVFSILYFFIIEMIFNILYVNLTDIKDFTDLNKFELFINTIPMRVVEIFIILLVRRTKMKIVYGAGVKRK